MKRIFLAIASVVVFVVLHAPSIAFADCSEIYFKVGAGYKFSEQDKINHGGVEYQLVDVSPYSARIESGVECGSLTWGISHHSQWATGAPFNDTGEYYKTEFFIDYKISRGI